MSACVVTPRHRRSRMRAGDLFDETLAGLFARPMRSLLTTLGTVIGLASLIATVGLSRTVPVLDIAGEYEHVAPVLAASAGLLDAVRGHVALGGWFDEGHVRRGDPVAVIGADLAAELGINRLEVQPGLYIGEHYFTVIGVVDEALRDRGFLGAVIITSTAGAAYFDADRPERVVIEVEIGA
jgi:hypothetical protein